MSEQLLNIIKKAAKEAIDESTPSNIIFGTVTSISPLNINVEQKMDLTSDFLILTKNVVDYTVDVSVNWSTENKSLSAEHNHELSGEILINSSSSINPNPDNISISINNDVNSSLVVDEQSLDLSHAHDIAGKKTLTIHNALKDGDKVILIRQQGGQKYVVLDKIY